MHQNKSLTNFRSIIQVKFDKIYAEISKSMPSSAALNDEILEKVEIKRKLHLTHNVSYDFEKSKWYKVYSVACKLLSEFENAGDENKIIIAAAIRYFLLDDDAVNDSDYFFGLEDDKLVLEAALVHIS